jgi:hypothetical protein
MLLLKHTFYNDELSALILLRNVMENLYELGKRVERLLYSSVFVILASFAFYSLSLAIVQDFKKSKLDAYNQILEELKSNYDKYQAAEDLSGYFRTIIDNDNSDISSDMKTKTEAEIEAKKNELMKENIARQKLNLPAIILNAREYNPQEFDAKKFEKGVKTSEINKIRIYFHIEEASNDIAASETYKTLIGRLIYRIQKQDSDILPYLQAQFKMSENLSSFTKTLQENAEDLSNIKIKIFGIEAPMQFPFSLGDMKSNISLYNVERIGMTAFPVFLVFWLGSICMTRNKEIYFLVKTRMVAHSYPHILNLFQFVDSEYNYKSKESHELNLLLIGVGSAMQKHRLYAISLFSFRVFVGCGLLLVITTPVYLGFINVIYFSFSQIGTIQLFILLICLTINAAQIISLALCEAKITKNFFYIQRKENGII